MSIAKTTIQIETSEGAKSMRQLKEEFKQAQRSLEGLTVGTKEYSSQLKKLGTVKNEMEDLNKSIEAFRPDKKLQAFIGVGRGLAAGFEAATAAAALFGAESESVEKSLLKVQSAMALANAVQEVSELGESFELLDKVLKSAVGATGIGLLVVAIGTISAYWDEIKAAMSGVSTEMEDQLELSGQRVIHDKESLIALDKSENILKLQGKSQKQILEMKIEAIKKTLEDSRAQLQLQRNVATAQIETAERNKKITQGILTFISTPIVLLLEGVDLLIKGLVKVGAMDKELNLSEKFTGGVAGLLFDPEETKKKSDETIKQMEQGILELENQQAGYKLSLKQMDEKAASDKSALMQKQADEQKKLLEGMYNKEAEYLRAKQQLEEQYRKQAEAEEAAARKVSEDAKKNLDNINIQRLQQDHASADEIYQAKKELLDRQHAEDQVKYADNLDKLREIDAKYQLDLKNIEKEKTENHKKEAEERNRIRQTELNVATNIVSSLGSIMQIVGEQGKGMVNFQKGLAVTQIAIDTAKAISSGIAASAGVPFPANLFSITTTIATVLANIAKAKQILQSAGGAPSLNIPGATGGGGGGSVRPPQINSPSNTSTLLDNLNNKPPQQPVIKTYVTETDITATQKHISRIERKTKY